MLHIRVVSPDALTAGLVERLGADVGVTNLLVLPGAGTAPRGDAVQFDVTSGSANSVLGLLHETGVGERSPIIIESIDAAINHAPHRPVWRLSHRGEQAPVWDLIEARIAGDASYAPSFFALLILAGLIGACGFALCIRGLGHTPELYRRGVRPVSDLINSPNLFSVVVAVVAGLVGVVSLTLSRTSAMIGVFISVTTIPAAADVAVSVAFGRWREAGGSGLQLLLNVGLLIIVGAVALRAQRIIWRRWTS